MQLTIGRLTVSLFIAAALIYLLAWPTGLEPQAWTPGADTGFDATGTSDIERLVPQAHGAAALFRDADHQVLAGLADGRFVRVADGAPLAARMAGRPQDCIALGSTRLLCVAAGQGAVLVQEEGALPLPGLPRHLGGVAVARDGAIYVSEPSLRDGDAWRTLIGHRGDGRLLRYDDLQNRVTVLLDDLQQPQGLALGPDDAYLLVSETADYRVGRYWLKGEKAGTREAFLENLPGFPAGLHWNGRDRFWLALYAPRIRWLDVLAPHPFLREVVFRLPRAVQPRPEARSMVLGLDVNGRIVHRLHAPGNISDVLEHEGAVYLGGPLESGVARVALH